MVIFQENQGWLDASLMAAVTDIINETDIRLSRLPWTCKMYLLFHCFVIHSYSNAFM